jgi:uncharacterized protein YukE
VTITPADLTDLAAALASRADAVQACGDDLAQKVIGAAWAGPVADRYRESVAQIQRRLAADSDRLRVAAADLRRLADSLDQTLVGLRAVEGKVRAWLAANPPGSGAEPPPWPPGALPPTGDPRWIDVQRSFAAAGIS